MPKFEEKCNPVFGKMIYSYSRAQAIEDGVLHDVSLMAKEAGFKYPVAVTDRVWEEVVDPPTVAYEQGESESGRLWDVLWMLRLAIGKQPRSTDIVHFEVLATNERNRKHLHHLWSVCGPGDDPNPVITIMMRGED